MRANWNGHIALGQLGFPVRLYNGSRSIRPAFKFLHEKDGAPVTRVYQCTHDDHEVSYSELVRAVQHNGTYIPVTDHELEHTSADKSKTIEIKQFFDNSAIEPIYYEKPYFIVPAKGGERAYALLREVLTRLKKLALAQFTIYNNEHIAALSAYDDLLILNQLRYAHELVPRSEIKSPVLPKPNPKEIAALSALVEQHSGPLFLSDYHDEQSERVTELVERKTKGLPAPRFQTQKLSTVGNEDLLPLLEDALNDTRES